MGKWEEAKKEGSEHYRKVGWTMSRWEEVKTEGSEHYRKIEGVQPIDLFRSGGILRDWVIGEIMQHAFRNRTQVKKIINPKDFEKIAHYCRILLADYQEGEGKNVDESRLEGRKRS
jgi:hypothetical protein